jgi:mannose-6-phosphate isomerase-like protein (cupin superfamily)
VDFVVVKVGAQMEVINRSAVGGTVIEHFHKTTEEFYYILDGTGLMKIEDEVREVGPGDTIVIVPGQRHKITNNGQTPLVLLACCSPEWTAEDQVLVEQIANSQ